MSKAIEIRGLKRRFGDKLAVDIDGLSVERGELLALLGVNGAGKTTTVRMLCGVLPPSEGSAAVEGFDVVTQNAQVKSVVAVSPQETAVAKNLTVRENLEFIAGISGADKPEAKRRAAELISALGLTDEADRRAKKLSGGMQRRLSIAMALISEPKVLFLDEPTLGLDVLARRELWRVIEGLRGETAIVLTTHYMEEAEALADRVAVMAKGRVKAVGSVAELLAQTGADKLEDAFVAIAGEGAI